MEETKRKQQFTEVRVTGNNDAISPSVGLLVH